jgi:hypothetical protein
MGWTDNFMSMRLIDKTQVGETPTGATDGTTDEMDRISRSETVALPGTQKLSVKRIGMDNFKMMDCKRIGLPAKVMVLR